MSAPRCEATNRHGQPCRAFALPGEGTCWTHSAAHAEERRAACRKGQRIRVLQGRRAKLDTAGSLLKFIANLAHDCLEGTVETDVARSVGYLLNLQVKLIETADLERRLAALEAELAAEGGKRWA